MKKLSVFFFLCFSLLIQAQDCDQIQASFEFRSGKLKQTILNGTNAFNQIDVKKSTGQDGSNQSSEFASLVYSHNLWMGGFDPAGNLKLAIGDYGGNFIKSDWYAGPLRDNSLTDKPTCDYWDRVHYVTKDDIMRARALFVNGNTDCDEIPENVKYWPARNNPFITDTEFLDDREFANFWDEDGDGIYNPCQGDLPGVIVQGCEPINVDAFLSSTPKQIAYWVTNDAGGPHFVSNSTTINVEVHNYALSVQKEGLEDVIFYVHNIVNRSTVDFNKNQVGAWFDFDIGCPINDFVGVSDDKKMLFAYNEVEDDLSQECPGGEIGFDEKPPLVGYTILQGNYEEVGELGEVTGEYVRNGISSAYIPLSFNVPGNFGPADDNEEFYFNLIGRHKDNSPQIDQNGEETVFSYVGNPADIDGGSLCAVESPSINTTAILTTGPGDLRVGQIVQIISAIFMSEDVKYPCPDISALSHQRELVEGHFNNCFKSLTGPTAPNLELNLQGSELHVNLSNDFVGSNNRNNSYEEVIPEAVNAVDNTYKFEGYKIFQVASEDFDFTELNNQEVSKLVYQGDLQNNISDISNWKVRFNGGSNKEYFEDEKVDGNNSGVASSIVLAEDAFTGSGFSANQEYYFVALAYAYNNYEEFNSGLETGQDLKYLESTCNVKVSKVNGVISSTSDVDISQYFDIKILMNQFEINSKGNELAIDLYDMSGVNILHEKIVAQTGFHSRDLSDEIASGVYILNVSSPSMGISRSFKVMVVN